MIFDFLLDLLVARRYIQDKPMTDTFSLQSLALRATPTLLVACRRLLLPPA